MLILGVPRLPGLTPNIGLICWVCCGTFAARLEAKAGGDLSAGGSARSCIKLRNII